MQTDDAQSERTGGDLFDGTFDKDDFEEALAAGTVSGEFQPENRWLYGIQHSGRIGHVTSRINYTAVSDRDYFRDLGSDLGVSSRIDLERRGELTYRRGGLFARAWAQRFQRLDEVTVDPYQRLPELELRYTDTLFGPLEYSLGAKWVSFTRHNDDLRGANAVVGDRLHLEPRLLLPLSWTWGFLNFTGGYRYTEYDLDDVPAGVAEKPDRGIALGSVDGGHFRPARGLRRLGPERGARRVEGDGPDSGLRLLGGIACRGTWIRAGYCQTQSDHGRE